MRYAIISDIHSNLEALTKALEVIEQHSVDEIICLGDIVGYGANPNECIELIQQRCRYVIKGNHDEAILTPILTQRFTEDARAAIQWTLQYITENNIAYLRSLAFSTTVNDLLFVHASPCNPEHWSYILEEETAKHMFECFSESLCFIGHTHAPAIFSPDGQADSIVHGKRFLINVGSIGQPRDQIPDLSFGIFDEMRWTYENIRCPHDLDSAIKKILASGLPSRLGHRLALGL